MSMEEQSSEGPGITKLFIPRRIHIIQDMFLTESEMRVKWPAGRLMEYEQEGDAAWTW